MKKPYLLNYGQSGINMFGKWKGVSIWYLKDPTMRYNELKKKITTISEKVLIKELRSLESDGIVSRKVYPEVPPVIEYSLTAYGEKLIPIFELISTWGNKHVELYGTLKE